jgi:hypothetical protein
MHCKLKLFSSFLILAICTFASAAPMKLTVAKHDQDRRYVVAEKQIPASRLAPPFKMTDEAGKSIACQWESTADGHIVRWLVSDIAAGQSSAFTLDHTDTPPTQSGGLTIKQDPAGWFSISNADHEITRYNVGPLAETAKKPYFYPVMAHGVSVTRAWPMEDKGGEAKDHPHHTGLYFAHGAINGKDYWSKVPITNKSLKHSAGPVYARLISENNCGEDMIAISDVMVIDAGQDVVIDWSETWKAPGSMPVALGNTKEGTFAIRVPTPLTAPDPGKPNQAGRGKGTMYDALGNQGELAIRPEKRPADKKAAAWAENAGMIDGKQIAIALMNHPTSYRFPTDWHVRHYGLFAANAFMHEADELKPNQPITFRYRVYIHNPTSSKADAVYAGYANNKVEGE